MLSSIQTIRSRSSLQSLQYSQFRLPFPLAIGKTRRFTSFTTGSHGTRINFDMSQMASLLHLRLSLSGRSPNRLRFPTKRRAPNSYIHTRTRKNDKHHHPHAPRVRRFPTVSSYCIRTEAIDLYDLHYIGIGCKSLVFVVGRSDEYCLVEIYES